METFVLVAILVFLSIYVAWLDLGLTNAKRRIEDLRGEVAFLERKNAELARQLHEFHISDNPGRYAEQQARSGRDLLAQSNAFNNIYGGF